MSLSLFGIILGLICNELVAIWLCLLMLGALTLLYYFCFSRKLYDNVPLWALVTFMVVPRGSPPAWETPSGLTVLRVHGNRCQGARCRPYNRKLYLRGIPLSRKRYEKGSWLIFRDPRLGPVPFITRRHPGESPEDLLRAMTLGGSAPRVTRTLFVQLGLAHLLAISGLHLGVVAMLAWFLMGGLFRLVPMGLGIERRHFTAFALVPVIWGYWYATGGAISTTRAAIMVTLYVLMVRPMGIGSP
ncbi:ComEC/Rec2 family competence protein, partial [Myxococcota bacterium]|nr:ComEC/Rec2 family competence protein [Myxococcota bacterium]